MSDQMPNPEVRRPGVVTFIAAILFIQAALAVTAMLTLTVRRGPILDYLEKEDSPLSSGAFTGTIVGEAIAAVLLLVVAAGLMRGSKGIRLLVAIVQGLTMALAMYVLVAHHVGGYMYRAVFSLFVGVFVLWTLYGNKESDEFFNSEWTES
jgi:hypothetical protein